MLALQVGDRVRHRRRWSTTGTISTAEPQTHGQADGQIVQVRWDDPRTRLAMNCWAVDLVRVTPLEELAREAEGPA